MRKQLTQSRRHEIKLVGGRRSLEKTYAWLMKNRLGFFQHHPDRYVNSVYFDTFNFRLYSDHINNQPQRRKVRFRWPHARTLPDAGNLEMKHKKYRLGWKDICPLEVPSTLTQNWQGFTAFLFDEYPDFFPASDCEAITPVLQTRFYRQYLISADGRLRVTVDTELEIFEQLGHVSQNFDDRLDLTDQCIVELKFEPADYDHLHPYLTELPSRPVRCSKYVTGVQHFSLSH